MKNVLSNILFSYEMEQNRFVVEVFAYVERNNKKTIALAIKCH